MITGRQVARWPLILIAAPAAVAVWSGWVGLGGLCGFGLVQPLSGIVRWHLDTAITLPAGVEAYGAYALGAWLTAGTPERARTFARRSAIGALALGVLGQVGWLPVVTLGFGAALTHLLRVLAAAQIRSSTSDFEASTAPELRTAVHNRRPRPRP